MPGDMAATAIYLMSLREPLCISFALCGKAIFLVITGDEILIPKTNRNPVEQRFCK